MARTNISTTVLTGQLGRRQPNTDGVIGFVGTGIAVASKLDLGDVNIVKSIEDVEALGINAAYDTANDVLLFHHLQRLFHWNPSAEVHLMVLAQTVTMTEICDLANTSYAKKLLQEAEGRVKLLFVNRNPASGYTPTLVTGLDGDVVTAIDKAQALIEEEAAQHREVSIFLEGRSFNGTAAAALDLRTKDAEGVSVIIAADNDISNVGTLSAGYAAIGDFAGMISKAAVSQTCCEPTADFNLQDASKGYFTKAGLSNNALIKSQSTSTLDTLDSKGYIFAEGVPELTGTWFNDTHTATLSSSDFAFIENVRSVNKMKQLARGAVMPKVKKRLNVDEETGYLDPHEKSNMEDTVEAALEPMKIDGDLSGGIDCYINGDVNLLGGADLDIEVTAVPKAIGRSINLKVGLKNPFNG